MEVIEKNDILKDPVIQKIISVTRNAVDPDKIILFGSRSRKESSATSDYDICIIKDNIQNRRKVAMDLYRILYNAGASIDIIVQTPQGYEELKDNLYYIYNRIESDGIILYEKS